jgi:hypothetical protein
MLRRDGVSCVHGFSIKLVSVVWALFGRRSPPGLAKSPLRWDQPISALADDQPDRRGLDSTLGEHDRLPRRVLARRRGAADI